MIYVNICVRLHFQGLGYGSKSYNNNIFLLTGGMDRDTFFLGFLGLNSQREVDFQSSLLHMEQTIVNVMSERKILKDTK